ncbi:hypothetical protein FHG87_005091 [Trinorchestia longiramus]|nr:hypothetical protein FHG87_005091 [Trinorchestia longiramus]
MSWWTARVYVERGVPTSYTHIKSRARRYRLFRMNTELSHSSTVLLLAPSTETIQKTKNKNTHTSSSPASSCDMKCIVTSSALLFNFNLNRGYLNLQELWSDNNNNNNNNNNNFNLRTSNRDFSGNLRMESLEAHTPHNQDKATTSSTTSSITTSTTTSSITSSSITSSSTTSSTTTSSTTTSSTTSTTTNTITNTTTSSTERRSSHAMSLDQVTATSKGRGGEGSSEGGEGSSEVGREGVLQQQPLYYIFHKIVPHSSRHGAMIL